MRTQGSPSIETFTMNESNTSRARTRPESRWSINVQNRRKFPYLIKSACGSISRHLSKWLSGCWEHLIHPAGCLILSCWWQFTANMTIISHIVEPEQDPLKKKHRFFLYQKKTNFLNVSGGMSDSCNYYKP